MQTWIARASRDGSDRFRPSRALSSSASRAAGCGSGSRASSGASASGGFWARATGDHSNVGMTLLRIDRGVDTGPVFGYFRVKADGGESHVVTQHRVVLDHLDAIRDKLLEIEAGRAAPLDTTGRKSATWG